MPKAALLDHIFLQSANDMINTTYQKHSLCACYACL